MKRKVFMLLCLLAGMAVGRAQSLSHYEYWIDGDHANRISRECAGEAVSLSLPLAALADGMHFFNFRAVNTQGEVSNVYRTMFYLPPVKPAAAVNERYEYWLDGDHADRISRASAGEAVSLSLPLAALADGLHFFNFRAVNTLGEVSNIYRTMFYLPPTEPVDVAGYEYWFDSDSLSAVATDASQRCIVFATDVSTLDEGMHTFHFRARNSFGEWGPTHEETFEVVEATSISKLTAGSDRMDVYNLKGEKVLSGASPADLLRLPPAIYVVGGRKVFVRVGL